MFGREGKKERKQRAEKLHSRLHVSVEWRLTECCSYLSGSIHSNNSQHTMETQTTTVRSGCVFVVFVCMPPSDESNSLRRHIDWPLSAFEKGNHIYFLFLLRSIISYSIRIAANRRMQAYRHPRIYTLYILYVEGCTDVKTRIDHLIRRTMDERMF